MTRITNSVAQETFSQLGAIWTVSSNATSYLLIVAVEGSIPLEGSIPTGTNFKQLNRVSTSPMSYDAADFNPQGDGQRA